MKKSKRVSTGRPAARRAWLCACALLVAGVATAAAPTYASRSAGPAKAEPATVKAQPADPYVTVEVGGKRLRVNAQTLQKGPLTQEQARPLAEQLDGNRATDGLVQERHKDGTVAVDLRGRFQNVTLARRNDDGTVSAACVDTTEAAGSFLTAEEQTAPGTGVSGKAAPKQ